MIIGSRMEIILTKGLLQVEKGKGVICGKI